MNEHHFGRLKGLVEDATQKGARAIELGTKSNKTGASRLFLPTLLTGVSDEMAVMQDEIFGPVLPIVPYGSLDEAVAYVNARPRPLALYLFSTDGADRRFVLDRTVSGNVVIDDTILHYARDDLPFGGVGSSGMGAYHGHEGFKSMSHAKGVFSQARFNLDRLVQATLRQSLRFSVENYIAITQA